MNIMGRLRLLPILLFVCLLSFAVRFSDVLTQVKTLDQAMTQSVMADDKKAVNENGDTETQDAPQPADQKSEKTPDDGESIPLPSEGWADPDLLDMQFSDTQSAILRELTERRKELDIRENRLNQKEALLKVTRQRLEEKTTELESLRSDLENLLGKQSKAEQERYKSLVKVYEGMKPKDASEIFDNLDMDVLLKIISRMSERKSAPIIALMDTKKAKSLTILLANEKTLPQ
jgi:flagellar motility protein MotE (MotC chaperone)